MENANFDRLGLVETFLQIVETGSLSAAAERLGTTQPTVSRRLQALETSWGVRLLHRSTHRMHLTVEGQRCYDRGKELLGGWNAFEADLKGTQEDPEGPLRVVAPHAVGQDVLLEPVLQFLRDFPNVRLEWLLQNLPENLVAAGIDCAIVVGEITDPGVVAVKVAEVPRIVVAHPALVEHRRTDDPDDLASLPWVALRTYYRNEVCLTHQKTGNQKTISIRPQLKTDNLYAIRTAILSGLGVGMVSSWVVSEDLAQGRLVHLVPGWRPTPLPVSLAYPYARFYPPRLLRFVEVMRRAIPTAIGS